MAVPIVAKAATKNPFKFTGAIGFIKILLIVIWLASTIITITTAYAKDGVEGIGNYLTDEVLIPSYNLQVVSLEIIGREGIYESTESAFKSFWYLLKDYWTIIYSLLCIYLWIRFLKIIVLWFFIGDTSRKPAIWSTTIAMFFMVQLILIGFFQQQTGLEGLLIPFVAIWDFLRSIPYLIPIV